MSKISKKKLPDELEKESIKLLHERIGLVVTNGDTEKFLNTFFTPLEKDIILRRLAVMILLDKKERYIDIETLLDISKATISKIKHISLGDGYGKNLRKLGKRVYSSHKSAVKGKRKKLFRPYKGAESII